MTAPGQEPDEVLTSTPGGEGPKADEPDLGKIGDNHMPEDLREAERSAAHDEADDETGDETGDRDEDEKSDEDAG
jgi:hypothetical protein